MKKAFSEKIASRTCAVTRQLLDEKIPSAVVLRPPGEPDERRTLTAAGALSSPSIAWPEDVASRSRSFAQVRGSSMSTVTAGHGHHAHTGMLAWERLGSRWTQTLVQPRGTVFTGHVEASCAAPAGPSGHGIAQEARSMTMCAAHAKSCRRSPCALLPRSLEAGLRRFVRNPSYPRSIRPCSARWCRFHRAELALGSGISGRTGVLRLRAPPVRGPFSSCLAESG